jgi:xylulokinase
MRSQKECEELRGVFDSDTSYHITGQPEIIPTWPVTKILWIKRNEPEIFATADQYLLLKDYIQYRLCGIFAGDHSIYNFSHYFNIVEKEYWTDMLDYVGIKLSQLPPAVPSCTVLGPVTPQIAEKLGLDPAAKVNVGTLDHFAGMIGTGNIEEGIITESTGTVLALATMINKPAFSKDMVQLHCGPFDGTYVFLPVCESGGISLEWFKRTFAPDMGFDEINKRCAQKDQPGKLLFLPCIAGTNAPDFNANASGVFFGFKDGADRYDFALAVMEGVAHMLNTNIQHLMAAGVRADRIVSNGGGTKSALWCQLKSDVTGFTMAVPKNKEAACLGAAMIGAVSENIFTGYAEAVAQCVEIEREYRPALHAEYAGKSKLYDRLYGSLQDVYALHAKELP